jgi:hypothetical protein
MDLRQKLLDTSESPDDQMQSLILGEFEDDNDN